MQRLSTPALPQRQSLTTPEQRVSFEMNGRTFLVPSTREIEPEPTTTIAQSLEERVQQLESQNDFLLNFFNYFKNIFPDLFRKFGPAKSSESKEASSRGYEEPHLRKCQHKALVTKRELEVLQLIAEGLSAKEIAHKLYISETTVITHKKNLKEKFGVKNTPELISRAGSFL